MNEFDKYYQKVSAFHKSIIEDEKEYEDKKKLLVHMARRLLTLTKYAYEAQLVLGMWPTDCPRKTEPENRWYLLSVSDLASGDKRLIGPNGYFIHPKAFSQNGKAP